MDARSAAASDTTHAFEPSPRQALFGIYISDGRQSLAGTARILARVVWKLFYSVNNAIRLMPRLSTAHKLFPARLRQARIEAGLTQVEVAKELRRPQSYVSKCESGERRVDVVELAEFAQLYKKELSFFIR
jgi:DNA-binding XRE family transcriptional regulator